MGAIVSLAAVLVTAGSTTGGAQRPAPGMAPPRFLDCTFTTSARVAWDTRPAGRLESEQGTSLDLRLESADEGRGTVEVMYGATATPAVLVVGNSIMHVIQPPENGAMVLIAVDLTSGDAQRFRASYSRTDYYAYSGPGFVSVPRAVQHYGSCAAATR